MNIWDRQSHIISTPGIVNVLRLDTGAPEQVGCTVASKKFNSPCFFSRRLEGAVHYLWKRSEIYSDASTTNDSRDGSFMIIVIHVTCSKSLISTCHDHIVKLEA